MMEDAFTVAAVQAASVWLDREETIKKACSLIRAAGANGASLIGFPENFVPGHPVWFHFMPASSAASVEFGVRLFDQAVTIPGPATDRLCAAARNAHINVVIGLTEKLPGTLGTLYNTQLFISERGEIVGKHQKLVATITERLVHAPGGRETQRSLELPLGTVSSLVCGENSNPLALGRVMAEYPLVHVASWPSFFSPPSVGGVRACSQLASCAVAYTCGCYVVASAAIASPEMIGAVATNDDDRAFMQDPDKNGGSCVIDPFGQVIAGPLKGDKEDIVYADCSRAACVKAKLTHDHAGHYNRADVYQLSVYDGALRLVTRRGGTQALGSDGADDRKVRGAAADGIDTRILARGGSVSGVEVWD